MWSSLYLALFALAACATYIFAVQEEAVVFSTATASACWGFLAVTGGAVEIVTESGVETVSVGAAQYIMLAFALLSLIALIGAILGWYPEEEDIHNNEFMPS